MKKNQTPNDLTFNTQEATNTLHKYLYRQKEKIDDLQNN